MTWGRYSIDMIIAFQGEFELLRGIGDRSKAMRILADVRRFVEEARDVPLDAPAPVRENVAKNCAQCGKRLWTSGPEPVLCTRCSHCH